MMNNSYLNEQSTAEQPDLDWSQVRETVLMLTASIAHVETAMREGSSSVNTLTNSFTSTIERFRKIDEAIERLEPGETKDAVVQHSKEALNKINASVVAFQFYDTLQQRLQHVSISLSALANLVCSPERLYNPTEWKKLQELIKSNYTMARDVEMFDAIMQGKSIDEAVSIATRELDSQDQTDDCDIELF